MPLVLVHTINFIGIAMSSRDNYCFADRQLWSISGIPLIHSPKREKSGLDLMFLPGRMLQLPFSAYLPLSNLAKPIP